MSQRLYSVTTFKDLGLPSPALLGWAVKATAEWAVDNVDALKALADSDREAALSVVKDARWRKSGPAAMRGTALHKAAEALAYGEHPEIEVFHQPWLDQYRRFLDDHQPEFEMAEASVYNLRYTYAGTLDAIVIVGGQRCVLDIKTHEKPIGDPRPPYPDVALQLAAYRHAELVGLGPPKQVTHHSRRYYLYDDTTPTTPMPETDGALALAVSPWDYTLSPVRTDEDVWQSFLYVREVARWALDISQTVLGPAIQPPARNEEPIPEVAG